MFPHTPSTDFQLLYTANGPLAIARLSHQDVHQGPKQEIEDRADPSELKRTGYPWYIESLDSHHGTESSWYGSSFDPQRVQWPFPCDCAFHFTSHASICPSTTWSLTRRSQANARQVSSPAVPGKWTYSSTNEGRPLYESASLSKRFHSSAGTVYGMNCPWGGGGTQPRSRTRRTRFTPELK